MISHEGLIVPPRVLPPTIPEINPEITVWMPPYLAALVIGVFFGWLIALALREKLSGSLNPFIITLPGIAAVLLSLRFGFGTELIQGSILCLLLLFASMSDIHTREVPDYIPIMIIITALIGTKLTELPLMLLAAVVITLPQLAVAILKTGSYGGADIKLMAACAFMLGFEKGLFAICVGLSLAVICTMIIRKRQKKSVNESFALIPYLAIGSMAAFFI
jgi:leader peptidase (prepilin peptidase)/N-methyltransferase